MSVNKDIIYRKLEALHTSPFRAKFHLGPKEREIISKKSRMVIRQHAHELINKRLAPALPEKDGKQTPFKGHPVFIAQHATATCCRGCLLKWHNIPKSRRLKDIEQEYIVDFIDEWITQELASPKN
jgi:hypothetical protein